MNNDLHNTDDLFNHAYRNFEEKPSQDTWNKISAELDRNDVLLYKRNFIGWKRIAIILFFLLSGFIVYEFRYGIKSLKPAAFETTATIKKSLRQNSKSKLIQQELSGVRDKEEAADETNVGSTHLAETGDSSANNKFKVQLKIPGSTDFVISIPDSERYEGAEKNSPIASVNKNNNDHHIENKKFKKISTYFEPVQQNLVVGQQPLRQDLRFVKMIPTQSMDINPLWNLTESGKVIQYISSSVPISSPMLKLAGHPKSERWTIGALVSNEWGMYLLNDEAQDRMGNPQDEKNEISARENHESSFSTALSLTRNLRSGFIIKVGVGYSNTSIGINPQYLYASQQSTGNIGYKYTTSSGYSYLKPGFSTSPAIGDSLQSGEAQHHLQLGSMQFMYGYKFGKNKFSVTPSAGISLNYITRATLRTEVKDAVHREIISVDKLSGTRKFFVGFVADMAIQYGINEKWSLNVLPAFRFALMPITKNNVVKTYPYSFSLGVGVSFSL